MSSTQRGTWSSDVFREGSIYGILVTLALRSGYIALLACLIWGLEE